MHNPSAHGPPRDDLCLRDRDEEANLLNDRKVDLGCCYDRSNALWLQIFQQAGLKVVKQQVQEGLPAGLFAVKM